MRATRRAFIGVLAAAAVLSAAACSSSSGSAPGSAASAGTGQAAGGPLLIGSMAPLTSPLYTAPDDQAGLDAAVASINAAGGVNGRPLKLQFCDTEFTVNGELDCTRQLIADKVIAAVSPLIIVDSTGEEWKLFQQAGIPVIGTVGASPAELNSPVVFPYGSGLPGTTYGAVANLLASGAKRVAIIGTTDASSQFQMGIAEAAFQSAGVTATRVVGDPQADPTLAAATAKATANGVDGIYLCPNPTSMPKIVSGIRQTGYTGKISTLLAEFNPQILKALGSQANGILITEQTAFPTDSGNPAIAAYQAAMKKYQPAAGIDADSLRTWTATELTAKVLERTRADTASAVLAAFENLSESVDIGTIAPYSVKGEKSPLPEYSRIFNDTVMNGVIADGEPKSLADNFVDPFTQLQELRGNR
jgi:branched-chain amino acid transport system substrate-binding protein